MTGKKAFLCTLNITNKKITHIHYMTGEFTRCVFLPVILSGAEEFNQMPKAIRLPL
jgi:hypothetical protein